MFLHIWAGANDIHLKELLTNTAIHIKLNLSKKAKSRIRRIITRPHRLEG